MGVTPRQLEQMQARLAGRRTASPILEPSLRGPGSGRQVIIGVDPSLRGTGYGVIRLGQPRAEALAFGVIPCPSPMPHSRCLLRIVEGLREVVRRHHPSEAAIEGLFYAQNLQTTLTMGEARGAAIFCLAEAGLEIHEIAPRKVKQAVVGFGAAQKLAVAKMVQRMLAMPELPAPDAADALAVALAHAQSQGRYSLSAGKII
jgi:crossover junction endodeoxyribonuclease RuvC